MMIVVPAFAERDHGERKIIAAVVRRIEAARAPKMRERIDAERSVKKHYCRDEETPHECRPSSAREQNRGQRDGRNPVIAIEPSQLGILAEIFDRARVVALVFLGKNPAYV